MARRIISPIQVAANHPPMVPGPIMSLTVPPVRFRMPWEHFVCSKCHQENPFAIWLTKQHCFEPHRLEHQRAERILVVVDPESMKMVKIRPVPPKGFTSFRGRFYKCRFFPNCRSGPDCNYAHSDAELDTWNSKKILTGEMSSRRSQAAVYLSH